METNVRLDDQVYRALRARAVLEGRTVGDLINEAIRDYLARFPVRQRTSTLRALQSEAFSEGNERLSTEIDAVLYGVRR